MESTAPQIPWILSGIVAAICLLTGYRLVRFSSRVGSAIFAVFLGLTVGQHLHSGWAVAAVLTASAIAGFLLGNAYYYVNMALVGAIMGAGCMLIGAGTLDWSTGLASALLGAMLTVRFERPIVILGTSMAGASILMQSMGLPQPQHLTWAQAALFVGLSALGGLVQARTTNRPPARLPARRDP